MNLVELDHALRKLRLSGMAAVLETRPRQAQTEKLAPDDLVSTLVADEPARQSGRLNSGGGKRNGSLSASSRRRSTVLLEVDSPTILFVVL